LKAVEQEVHLGLERIALAILVEILEERILFDLLEHELRLQPLREQPGQTRLANSDHALDDDVSILEHLSWFARGTMNRLPRTEACELLQQRLARPRVYEQWIDLDERYQRERAVQQLGVRHGEPRLVDDPIAREQQVEVDRARTPALAADAPERALEALQVPH